MKTKIAAAALLVALASGGGAVAHHSGAMFEPTKTVTLNATVKTFDWTNPHAWIHVVAPGPGGAMQEWAVECSTINIIARKGWKPTSMKPGDKVTVVLRPAKDGAAMGLVMNVKLANGTVLVDHDY